MHAKSLLISEPPLQVLPSLAALIGLNNAIVLQQVHYWLENPRLEGRFIDGKKWIFNTYEAWQENFPFWSVSTIKRIFLDLEKMGLIISAQFDRHNWDQRKFYCIDYDALDALFEQSEGSSSPRRQDQNDTTDGINLTRSTLTETTTETTTESLCAANIFEPSIEDSLQTGVDEVDTHNIKDESSQLEEPEETKKFTKSTDELLDLSDQVESIFCELTQLRPPNQHGMTRKENWWNPLSEIIRICDFDVGAVRGLMTEAIKILDEKKFTISSPRSILATCRSAAARMKREQAERGPTDEEVLAMLEAEGVYE